MNTYIYKKKHAFVLSILTFKLLTILSNAACCTIGGLRSLRNTLPMAGSDQHCGIKFCI